MARSSLARSTVEIPTGASPDALPAGWRSSMLGEVARIALGRTPARDNETYWSSPDVPWVAIADLNGGRLSRTRERISRKAHDDVFGGRLVPPGTLLLSFKLTIGKTAVLEIPAVHNEAIANLVIDEKQLDRDFLAYQFANFDYTPYLDAYVKGKTLNKEKLNRLRLVIPPLPEQRAITSVLKTIERAAGAADSLVTATRALELSLLRYLFTFGFVAVPESAKVARSDTTGTSAPKSWRPVTLGEVASLDRGVSWGKADEAADGIPVITIPNVGETVSFDVKYRLGKAVPAEKLLCDSDVLLVGSSGTLQNVGRSAMVGGPPWKELTFASFLVKAESRDATKLSPRFLPWLLKSHHVDFTKHTKRAADGKFNLQVQSLREAVIPLPPRIEQDHVAEALERVVAKRRAHEAHHTAFARLFRSLLSDLMAGRRRVKGEVV